MAAIWVVVTHVCFWTGFYGHGLLGALSQRLEAGVAVFFVLSGFLLSYPWLRQLRTGARRDSIGRYAFKRVLRIMPVYWVAVVAAVLLIPQNDDTSLPRTIDALLMIDMYKQGLLLEGMTQMWSLATEVAFYATLPVLMALLVRHVARKQWQPARMLAALAVVASHHWPGLPLRPDHSPRGVVGSIRRCRATWAGSRSASASPSSTWIAGMRRPATSSR